MDEQLVKPLNEHEQEQSKIVEGKLDVRKKRMELESNEPLVVEQGMSAQIERKRRKLKEKKMELAEREKGLYEKQLTQMRDEIESLRKELVAAKEKNEELRDALLNERSKSLFQPKESLLAARRR